MKDHIHSFVRVRGKKDVYKCTDPDCKYYSKRNLLEGKRAKCGLCGNEEFILTRVQLENKTPRCSNCQRKPKEANQLDLKLGGMFEI